MMMKRMNDRGARHRIRVPSALTLLAALVSLLISSAALATPMYFAEMKTIQNRFFFSDMKITAEAPHRVGLLELAFSGDKTGHAGLGAGYVSPNNPLIYNHDFAPSSTTTPTSIISASLSVALIDDQTLDPPEYAQITIDGSPSAWQSGQATFNFLHGTVLAQLNAGNGSFQVTVSSATGDFHVLTSLLRVKYETANRTAGNAAPIPEPGALALFCAGCLVLGTAERRRRVAG